MYYWPIAWTHNTQCVPSAMYYLLNFVLLCYSTILQWCWNHMKHVPWLLPLIFLQLCYPISDCVHFSLNYRPWLLQRAQWSWNLSTSTLRSRIYWTGPNRNDEPTSTKLEVCEDSYVIIFTHGTWVSTAIVFLSVTGWRHEKTETLVAQMWFGRWAWTRLANCCKKAVCSNKSNPHVVTCNAA